LTIWRNSGVAERQPWKRIYVMKFELMSQMEFKGEMIILGHASEHLGEDLLSFIFSEIL
jgi:hypothetical protein